MHEMEGLLRKMDQSGALPGSTTRITRQNTSSACSRAPPTFACCLAAANRWGRRKAKLMAGSGGDVHAGLSTRVKHPTITLLNYFLHARLLPEKYWLFWLVRPATIFLIFCTLLLGRQLLFRSLEENSSYKLSY